MKWQLLLWAACLAVANAATTRSNTVQNIERNVFATDIYNAIGSERLNDNVVISPAAIQIAMALTFYGAKGKTAVEMQNGLRLGSSDPDEVVKRFKDFQQSFVRDNSVRLANYIFINEKLEFKGKFREIAQHNFDSNIEKADFHPPYNKRTADMINKMMQDKTNNKITNIIKPEQMKDLTEGVLVNGATFSAPWQNAFKLEKTTKRSFTTGARETIQVDTMQTLNNFQFGEISNLDAKVIKLPYQNSDFSMLLLLPNKKDGLGALIRQLNGKNIVSLVDGELSSQKVEVHLPKFSTAFGIDLAEPFKKLGVSTLFSREGDLGNMYRMFVSHHLDSANHKAFVGVSEEGTTPSLESGGLKNIFSRNKKFDADHPFIFVVLYQDSIIFMGHIANYAYV